LASIQKIRYRELFRYVEIANCDWTVKSLPIFLCFKLSSSIYHSLPLLKMFFQWIYFELRLYTQVSVYLKEFKGSQQFPCSFWATMDLKPVQRWQLIDALFEAHVGFADGAAQKLRLANLKWGVFFKFFVRDKGD